MKKLIAFLFWIKLLWLVSYTGCNGKSARMLSFLSRCKADEKEPYSYRGRNGPKFWGETFPACNGKEQSPIAINSRTAPRDANLPKLFMHNYDIPVTKATIENNGNSIQVNPMDGVARTIFINGATYSLDQMHFHWGDDYNNGAEHIIDGIQYAMEMHFVHLTPNNQIAVVGVFFQEQSQTSEALQNIIKEFPKVTFKDMTTQLTSPVNLTNLVPSNPASFYFYPGSLTNPPCTEGVTWFVLPKPLPVGLDQMKKFRSLNSARRSKATRGCTIQKNFRPSQPINHRTVVISQ